MTTKDADGNDVVQWFLLRNPQFKHLNLCLNQIDDAVLEDIEDVLRRTPDDFGFTLSGNPLTPYCVQNVHKAIEAVHRQRTQELRLADPGNGSITENADIAQKRLAF